MSWNEKRKEVVLEGFSLGILETRSLDHVGIAPSPRVPIVNIATAPDTVNFVAPRQPPLFLRNWSRGLAIINVATWQRDGRVCIRCSSKVFEHNGCL